MKVCESIEDVRLEIDALDDQIIELIARREKFVMQAAKFKKDSDAVKSHNPNISATIAYPALTTGG